MTDRNAPHDAVPNAIEDYANEAFTTVDAVAAFVGPANATQAAGQTTYDFVLGLDENTLLTALNDARGLDLVQAKSIVERYAVESPHNQDVSAAARQNWIDGHPAEVARSEQLAATINTTVDAAEFKAAIKSILEISGIIETTDSSNAKPAQTGTAKPGVKSLKM